MVVCVEVRLELQLSAQSRNWFRLVKDVRRDEYSIAKDFRLALRGRTFSGTNVRHAHVGIEFHYCEAGKGFFRSGGIKANMGPGLMTALFGPKTHQVASYRGTEYCRTTLHIPESIVEDALRFLRFDKQGFLPSRNQPMIQFQPRTGDYADIMRVYRRLHKEHRSNPHRLSPAIHLYTAELLHIMSLGSQQVDRFHEHVNPYDRLLVSRTMEIIDSNPLKSPPVSDLANQIGVTRGHLWRVFMEVRGVSPKEYALERQMEAAKEHLLAGSSITNLAQKCGYSNGSSFGRAFRAYAGMSPSMYVRSRRLN